MASIDNPCIVRIESFEGPLDLLLHLIKKSEVDIYDLPIAPITEQYIEYLDLMRELDIEIAGEYMVIAAELGLIKSRLLLPQPDLEEDEEWDEDPREELVRRLLEYQRYKDASLELAALDILGRDVFTPPAEDLPQLASIPQEIERKDVWALVGAVQDILRRRAGLREEPLHLELEPVSLEERIEEIDTRLRGQGKILFDDLFNPNPTKFMVVITFLAVLELIKKMVVRVFQAMPFSRIELIYNG